MKSLTLINSTTLLNSLTKGTISTSHIWVDTALSIVIGARPPWLAAHKSAAAKKVGSGPAKEPEQAR